jgi:peroxiredoxin
MKKMVLMALLGCGLSGVSGAYAATATTTNPTPPTQPTLSALEAKTETKMEAKTEAKTETKMEAKMAPDFDVKDIHNVPVKLSDLKGKIVVLEWTNSGCPFVRKQYDSKNMQDLQKKYTQQGVVWISVISSAPGKEGYKTAEEAKQQIKQDDSHATHLVLDPDGKLGHLYEAKTTPHLFVIDKMGKIVYAGAIDDKPSTNKDDIKGATNYVAQTLDPLLAGKEVPVKITESYGCSVKYAG